MITSSRTAITRANSAVITDFTQKLQYQISPARPGYFANADIFGSGEGTGSGQVGIIQARRKHDYRG
jgi:hypothetical protein